MANPTAKTSIPKYANLKAALWVTDQIDQSGSLVKGAWDALTGTYYAGFGTANLAGTAAMGTSGQNGLLSTAATVTGVALEATDNATGGIYEPVGPITVVALVRAKSSNYSNLALAIQNKGGFSPYAGYGLGLYNTGVGVFFGGSTEVPTSGQFTSGEVLSIAFTYDRTTTRVYKNGTSIGTPSTAVSGDLSYATSSRRAALFDYAQSAGKNAEAIEVYAVLVWHDTLTAAEIQSFGTTEAALLAGDFHTAAFSFGTVLGGNVTLDDTAPAGGLSSVSSSLGGAVTLADVAPAGTLGAVPGTFTSEALKDWTGTVQASVALTWFRLYNPGTGALVVEKTGLSTNGSGVVSFSDGAITAATSYAADWLTAGGARRMPVKAAT